MKSIVLIASLLFASLSFASSVENKIKQVEVENNARCEHVKTSGSLCFGGSVQSNVCFYTVKYNCLSNDGDFVAKLKVKSTYDLVAQKTVTKVRKVKIKK